jgi:uncharacterized protein YlxW (UPF0749 family)
VTLDNLDYGWLGIWLLIVSVAAMVLESILAALWSVRIVQRSRELSERLASERTSLQADVERLLASIEEINELWQPYRRLLRWLQHPLAIALVQSLLRRRATAR